MLATLISETQASSGAGVAGVNILNREISNIQEFIPCPSGIKIGADGVLSVINAFGGFSAISGEWLITGASAGFWVRRSFINGTLQVDPGAGFLQLNVDRIYDNIKFSQGVKDTSLFLEFSDNSSGTPVINAATFQFTSEQSTFLRVDGLF